MLAVYFLLLFLTTNWVLASESPLFHTAGNTSSPVPPTGDGGNSVIHLPLQLTQGIKDLKQDASQVKVDVDHVDQVQLNQAVLQQDLTSVQMVSTANHIKLEGKYRNDFI